MTDAKSILDREDATQDEVNTVKSALVAARGALVEKVIETNKLALAIAIDMAEAADLENVVPTVVTEFNEALEMLKQYTVMKKLLKKK